MTSRKGAGYKGGQERKPDTHAVVNEADASGENLREDKIRQLEAAIHDSVDASSDHLAQGDAAAALSAATSAVRDLEALTELAEPDDDSFNELAGTVWLVQALAFEANGLETEAIETYTTLLNNRRLGDVSRFRVNLANLHFKRGEYPKAVKMYKMALDKLPESQKRLKNEVVKNIVMTSLKMGRVKEAVEQYERLLQQGAVDTHVTGDLMLCYVKLGDIEGMKALFAESVRLFSLSEDESRHSKESPEERDRCLIACADLIASKATGAEGVAEYDACIQVLRRFRFTEAADEVLLSKADALVTQRSYDEAILTYKEIEKRSSQLEVSVARRLACLCALKGDVDLAAGYVQSCTKLDRYSHECWVNKGNVYFSNDELSRAKVCFEEALQLDPESTKALYNYGLTSKKIAAEEENEDAASKLLTTAENAFRRVHSALADFAECVVQIGSLCEMSQRDTEAVEWFDLAHGLVPDDPGLLAKLGALHQALGDEAKALRHYQDAYELYPADMDVLCWLAAFYVNNELYENASVYFKLAADLQPTEIKWSLMVAGCYRRAGLLNEAYEQYLDIHQKNPDSVECLRFLIPLCEDIGKGDKRRDFEEKLAQCEKTRLSTLAPPVASKTRLERTPPKPSFDFEAMHATRFQKCEDSRRARPSVLDDWGQGGIGEDLLPL